MENPHATIIFADIRGFTQWSSDVEVSEHLGSFLQQFYTIVRNHFSGAFIKELGDGVMIVDEMQEEEIPTTEENVANLIQSILLKISGVGGTFATICREFAMRYGFSANLHLGWGVTRGRVIKMSEPRADYLGANINKCSYLCGIARPWGIVMDREDFTELSPSAPFQFIPQERKLAGMAKTIPVWVTLEIANEFIPREQLRQTPEVHVAGVCIRQENGTIKVLVAKRTADRDLYPGLYEGCGGQLASGESLAEGVERHFKYEMGIDVEVLKDFYTLYEIREPGEPLISGIRMLCRYQQGTPTSPRHSEILWVTEDELNTMAEDAFIPGLKAQMLGLIERYRMSGVST